MEIKDCDRVLLKNDRKGTILCILKEKEAYEIEMEDIEGIDYAHECPTEIVRYEDISKVLD